MAFFENLGRKVGEATQAVAKKSSEIVETTKLNSNINSEEDKIQKLYIQIGKAVYAHFTQTGAAEDYIKEACEAITGHEQNIAVLREKIAEVKGTKNCVNCGVEMERTQIFCSKCGTKNELSQAAAPVEEAQQASEFPCPSCGTQLPEGSAFCTNCGTKI
ncbi:MAG: zinc ribbon domain-containing protein [Clostridiaceae bacterium]|jgi:DNA-directed RNA polymerase subunit RPC12/RpoP|nr:zinc ribbon domain-containing protein [Clostridiaceae bacterium]